MLSGTAAMELKVWVDGIQRVVCGVSEQTTCQEVVIALAQAIDGPFRARAAPQGEGTAAAAPGVSNGCSGYLRTVCQRCPVCPEADRAQPYWEALLRQLPAPRALPNPRQPSLKAKTSTGP
ncbi:Ras association domain family member 7 [Phyllostomus discolor]|uniref:Ras association domain family member 7 n=1 Tax=Phyllostomus discolor TaxID=89673 RepID=A0A834A0B3_9CHIR|nr:Ras association domain family member 7 [Phyllostomus discolor]